MSGGDSKEDTPVPIPNTAVKLLSADGSVSESRTLPGKKSIDILTVISYNNNGPNASIAQLVRALDC